MSRIACLSIPSFPLAARLRREPELATEPLVVLEGNGDAAHVAGATRVARLAGLRPGLSLPQARSLLPSLLTRRRDSECEQAAHDTLLEIAASVSPRIEDAGEGIAYAEVRTTERHYPGKDPETELGRSLIAAARRNGLWVRVGIAASKLAARVAAGLPCSPTLVATGEEASFLAPLPLAHLAPEPQLAALLARWGLVTIGDFARLPADEVTSRLGEAGRQLHEEARGVDPRPLVPRQPPPELREGMDFEWPVTTEEPLLFMARPVVERLMRRLETRGEGCLRLGLSLQLEPHGRHERTLALPAPTRDVKTLLTLIRLDLAASPPGAAVVGFAFTVWPAQTRRSQLSLLGPAELQSDLLATTLGQIAALLGPGRLGTPATPPGHVPERFALEDFAPPPPPRVRPAPPESRQPLVVRALRPPLPLEVLTTASGANGVETPERVDTLIKTIAADAGESRRLRIAGAARFAAGPWVVEEGWWSDSTSEREYWDVELSNGGTYRLYRERKSGEWFADGIYD
jgi:protein ImuB